MIWRLLLCLMAGAIFLAGPGTAIAAYQLSNVTYPWDGTAANRLLPEVFGEPEVVGRYQFDYGDDASVVFDLPWPFRYNGQPYTQLTALADGTLRLNGTNAPEIEIKAWNADLDSYYAGGVFVEYKDNPEGDP